MGHAAYDAVYQISAFPPRPLKVRALRYDESVGGMSANAACAVAALGGHAIFWGPLGDDDVARRIREEFSSAGVDLSPAFVVPGSRSSHSAIIVDGEGERLIVSRLGSALQGDVQWPEPLPDADVMLVDVRWDKGAMPIVQRHRGRLPIVLDGEMGNARLLSELVPLCDHLIFSENGFREWLALRDGSDESRQDTETEDILQVLAGLVAQGAALAAVTCGERGVLFAHRESRGQLQVFPVEVVETLGAGDAFHGAYALELATRRHAGTQEPSTQEPSTLDPRPQQPGTADIEAALRYAAAAAAIKCSRSGGRAGLASAQEVEALLQRHPDLVPSRSEPGRPR